MHKHNYICFVFGICQVINRNNSRSYKIVTRQLSFHSWHRSWYDSNVFKICVILTVFIVLLLFLLLVLSLILTKSYFLNSYFHKNGLSTNGAQYSTNRVQIQYNKYRKNLQNAVQVPCITFQYGTSTFLTMEHSAIHWKYSAIHSNTVQILCNPHTLGNQTV
jgi:hypothetical protein